MVTKQLKGATSVADYDDVDAVLEGEAENITELMEDIDGELNKVTSEFGKDKNDVFLKIKLHRVLERKGEREWLFDILPSELPIMDRVRDEFGGGRYVASLFKDGVLYRRFNFNIASPRHNFVPKSNTSDLTNIVNMLAVQQDKQFAQLKELMQASKPAQSFNMLEMMTGMVTLLANMKNLMPQPAPAGNQVDAVLKGMELMRDFTGDKGESSLIDIFRDLIKSPLLEKALEGTAAIVPNPALATPALLNSASAGVSAPKLDGDNKMNLIIKGYLNMLVKKAAQDSDPELYAAFILDNVPEKTVREYLLRDDLMITIAALNPAAAQYAPWFTELKNNITQILSETDPENLTQPGDDADTSTDAGEPSTAEHTDEPPTGESGH